MEAIRTLCIVTTASFLVGCLPLKMYRTDYSVCASADADASCATHALQEHKAADPTKPGYTLGIVELDDQGQLFDRAQMQAVLDKIYEIAAVEEQDYLNVVFVHGWKHSAAPYDDNLKTFRAALLRLSEKEYAVSEATGARPRKVVGVYIGWRGGSVSAPVLKELTFWDRKNTAHEVGHGGVTEVLNRLDAIRRTKDSLANEQGSRSRLVIIGHSFGGAIVYSALGQILESRFIRTVGPAAVANDAEGFGNLVVLINPAFEAGRFSSLSDMSLERGSYFKSQLPVLAVLTSEKDNATKIAFPAGRRLSTLFEKERKIERYNPVTKQKEVIDERDTNVVAIGHYKPYRTHYLSATSEATEAVQATSRKEAAQSVLHASQRWEDDAPGSQIYFPGSLLKRTDNSAGRNPYLVVQVDPRLIRDHNDISDRRVAEFITHLILVAGQSKDLPSRASERSKGLQ